MRWTAGRPLPVALSPLPGRSELHGSPADQCVAQVEAELVLKVARDA